MTDAGAAAQMRHAASVLRQAFDDQQRKLAVLPFADDSARRWLEYRPADRPGACLALLSPAGRKAAHRLLATVLSDGGYAQAVIITALEEVLDRQERWQLGRHSGDYWVSVFGDPAADDAWSWRFEGHHLSVTVTVLGDVVSAVPVFMGAHPALVSRGGLAVSRPLAPEEDLAWALLAELGPAERAAAVVSDEAPADIHSSTSAQAAAVHPLGVPAGQLRPTARALLDQLVALYLDRLQPALAATEAASAARGELHFAWEGPLLPGSTHYYRIQGADLLIEFDKTEENHAHTVLRRPRGDFGADLLAAHYRDAHQPR
jgi:Protein of unknown function (DUF3500)